MIDSALGSLPLPEVASHLDFRNKRMNKKLQYLAAAAFLALSTWLFIWPAFSPYLTFVIPLPGTSEIKSIRVEKNIHGTWAAYVEYFFTGWPTQNRISVALLADPNLEVPDYFNANQGRGVAVRGLHTLKLELNRPQLEEAFTTKKIEVTLSDYENGGRVIATKSTDVVINWPNRRTYDLNRKVSSRPQSELYTEAVALIDKGDSRNLVEAKQILEGLVERDPRFSDGIGQLVRIESLASWTRNGISKINSWKDMHDVTNGLYISHGFSEMDQLATNLIETKVLSEDGIAKLKWFHQAINGEYVVQDKLSDKYIKKIESDTDELRGAWIDSQPGAYLPHILHSKILIRVALQVRGNGFTNTIPKEKLERYHALAQRAVAVLARCKAICDTDPEWYSTTITAMRLASMDRVQIAPVFVEGFTRFPWYQYIYFSMAPSFAPYWGGSVDEIESFAQQLASRFPRSEQNPVYARLYSFIYGNGYLSNETKSSAMDCNRALNGFELITQKWPSNFNFNSAARMAKVCNNKSVARRYFARIGNNADLSIWTSAEFSNAVNWAQ